jgi:membrane-bound serine protease (ClpP class)
VLGFGGLAAVVLGAAVAFDFTAPGFRLSPMVVAVAAGLGGLLLIATIRTIWRSRGRPAMTGGQAMIGAVGRVLDWSGNAGTVLVHGERWAATALGALVPGQAVRVLARRGLRLEVTAEPTQEKGDVP